ncbi:expressed unknown protein [Seminavis robusta]|uniref:Uncharacterized protein n=1 Tax=Seminavis robusta TaxID=568900 RepID=A0A9N8DRQ4_9STRA|nr:expressed unknown protein [Seminavis robusta]|eukprot:Sro322_g117120.1 n/a (149) ;mRNA; r:63589-64035
MVQVTVTKEAKNASASFIWSKLAAYSDMSWHPGVKSSKNTGSIPDGSPNMIGAERLLVNSSDKELVETVTAWSDEQRYYACSIDKGAPPFAKEMTITFRVREVDSKVLVDMIVDIELKVFFACLGPLLKVVLGKKLGGFVDGISDLKE